MLLLFEHSLLPVRQTFRGPYYRRYAHRASIFPSLITIQEVMTYISLPPVQYIRDGKENETFFVYREAMVTDLLTFR